MYIVLHNTLLNKLKQLKHVKNLDRGISFKFKISHVPCFISYTVYRFLWLWYNKQFNKIEYLLYLLHQSINILTFFKNLFNYYISFYHDWEIKKVSLNLGRVRFHPRPNTVGQATKMEKKKWKTHTLWKVSKERGD